MTSVQARPLNPNVPCTPGLCLTYVQDVAKIKTKYPSAISSWNASQYKHQDQNFPAGVWVPLWFKLSDNVNGHVVWREPDGSIWSASHPIAKRPVHHVSLQALMSYYGGRLRYLGWTEDVEDTLIIVRGEENMDAQDIRNVGGEIWGVAVDEDTVRNLAGKPWHDVMYYLLSAFWWTNRKAHQVQLEGQVSALTKDNTVLTDQVSDLEKKLDQAQNANFEKVDVYVQKTK